MYSCVKQRSLNLLLDASMERRRFYSSSYVIFDYYLQAWLYLSLHTIWRSSAAIFGLEKKHTCFQSHRSEVGDEILLHPIQVGHIYLNANLSDQKRGRPHRLVSVSCLGMEGVTLLLLALRVHCILLAEIWDCTLLAGVRTSEVQE